MTTPFTNYDPAISPDGKWLAYASERVGPQGSLRAAVPVAAGTDADLRPRADGEPVWARTVSRLYYRGGAKIMAVDVSQEGRDVDASAAEGR